MGRKLELKAHMEAAMTRGGEVGPWCLKVLEGATTLRTGVAGETSKVGSLGARDSASQR